MLPTQISDIKMDGLKKQPVIRQNAANLLDFRIENKFILTALP
jgi:hypothetical protein